MRSTGEVHVTSIVLRTPLYFMYIGERLLHLIIHQNPSAYIETLDHLDSLDACPFYSTSIEDPLHYWDHSPWRITPLSVKDQIGDAHVESRDFGLAAFSWPTFSPLTVAPSMAFVCRVCTPAPS